MNNHTEAWLAKQPLWKDVDLGIAMLVAFAIGFGIGAVLFW